MLLIFAFSKSLLLYQIVNKMQKGTTVFYHKHIQSNIAKLEERKDKFIHNRIQFLKQYCLPIQQRIDLIKREIEKYNIMRDTQEEVIQTDPEIDSLKSEVASYQHTREYFNQKVNEYEQKSLQYQQYNQNLKKQLLLFRKGLKNHQEELGFQLPCIPKKRVSSMQDQSDSRSVQSKSFVLPTIRHQRSSNQTEISLTESKFRLPKKKIINISEKIQRFKSHTNVQKEKTESIEGSIKQEPQGQTNQQIVHKTKISQLRQRITQFNKTQTLFHDCFEVKKGSVQKSVSQLQSKLIANRQEFLNTCQAIGSKEGSIRFEEFGKLSPDEILTLFISFVWLNKKINAQFVAKRKLIMQFVGKLPRIEIK